MLGHAWRLRQPGEVAGQLFRMALAPLGHFTGRTPAGNTGRSNVSAFAPMPIPPDLHSAPTGTTKRSVKTRGAVDIKSASLGELIYGRNSSSVARV
ncbi:DUF3703 domain-containing protein [Sphingomonas sp. CBMAI 2297]|nr:DUF3703 domain-containing protein [Sphingomonas sp. CBMAI 2297]MDH4746257.1 DUF3703 domain-containing protein [Sphingomonas sp. CBMAI 2297]